MKAKGNLDAAIAAYKEAIRLDPKYGFTHNGLVWLFATGSTGIRHGKLAVEHTTKACELSAWKNPIFFDTLAAAFAEAGDFEQAVATQKKALAFPEFQKEYGTTAQQRLELYMQKKPYFDPALQPKKM